MSPSKPKRQYSRDYTPRSDRRVQLTIDRIPPTLMAAVRSKAKREGRSIRALILGWLTDWTMAKDNDLAARLVLELRDGTRRLSQSELVAALSDEQPQVSALARLIADRRGIQIVNAPVSDPAE